MYPSPPLKENNLSTIPLCIDLDGSLIHSDMLHDSAIGMLKRAPLRLGAIPVWLMRGKAATKRKIAVLVDIDPSSLPYNRELLEWLVNEKRSGRKLVLATASDAKYAHAVADHLGLFDEVLASDGVTNLSSANKASALVSRFGEKGFDYVGNSTADIAVWRSARKAVVVGDAQLATRVEQFGSVERYIPASTANLKTWIKGLRLHQWMKNLLVFLPLFGAHRWGDFGAITQLLLAFICFGLTASAVYVLNDLLDLESDRQHPRKRMRPFAAGVISVPVGLIVSLGLFASGLGLSSLLGKEFILWLLAYVALTTTYSFALKRLPLIDCLALAGLYTLRIVAGGAAITQPLSFWLLAFSLFLFLSLAFIKRYSELVTVIKEGKVGAHGRGYRSGDLQLLQSIGLSSGFASTLVMALYLNSTEIAALYHRPPLLWFTMPILLFWISWVWLKTSRDEMHDDPVVFAVRDPASLVAGSLFVMILWLAS